MSGHTPGPWRVEHRGEGQGVAIMAHDEMYPVARCFSHHKHRRGEGWSRLFDASANARLVAAVPLAFRALAAFVSHEGECMGDAEWDGPGCYFNPFGREERCPWCKGMEALDQAGLLDCETGEPTV